MGVEYCWKRARVSRLSLSYLGLKKVYYAIFTLKTEVVLFICISPVLFDAQQVCFLSVIIVE